MAPKMRARGLASRAEAAPVLWGGPPVLEPVGVRVAEAVRETERVAEEMVALVPAEGLMVAEAATLLALARTEETEAFALETAADAEARAEDRAAEAEETAEDPPVKGNWPE
tara:strand:- start:43728 stop:44063 length:336 start_codon:yes stop_codon:yes gene_type:complete